jgi:lysozyme
MDNGTDRRKIHNRRRGTGDGAAKLLTAIFLCFITLFAITFSIIVMLRYRSLQSTNEKITSELEAERDSSDKISKEEAEEEASQASSEAYAKGRSDLLGTIRNNLLNGQDALSLFRKLYPDQIVLIDNNAYSFNDIRSDVAKHTYVDSQFTTDPDGKMVYKDTDGNVVSEKGIDVSKFQGTIDWKKVAADGVKFAFIRVGARGYTKGTIAEDETFKANMEGAEKNGIKIGVYFFTAAVSDDEIREEAQYVLNAIEPYKIDYPVVLDIEKVSDTSEARTDTVTQAQRTEMCRTFCDEVTKAGYKPMIYGNLKTYIRMLDLSKLEDYPKWFACYDTPMYYPYDYSIWQYSDSGRVDGIKGNVDLNLSFYKAK